MNLYDHAARELLLALHQDGGQGIDVVLTACLAENVPALDRPVQAVHALGEG